MQINKQDSGVGQIGYRHLSKFTQSPPSLKARFHVAGDAELHSRHKTEDFYNNNDTIDQDD